MANKYRENPQIPDSEEDSDGDGLTRIRGSNKHHRPNMNNNSSATDFSDTRNIDTSGRNIHTSSREEERYSKGGTVNSYDNQINQSNEREQIFRQYQKNDNFDDPRKLNQSDKSLTTENRHIERNHLHQQSNVSLQKLSDQNELSRTLKYSSNQEQRNLNVSYENNTHLVPYEKNVDHSDDTGGLPDTRISTGSRSGEDTNSYIYSRPSIHGSTGEDGRHSYDEYQNANNYDKQ
ncbi:unnamed protein product, partial [Meganyctiphanes norvegica]